MRQSPRFSRLLLTASVIGACSGEIPASSPGPTPQPTPRAPEAPPAVAGPAAPAPGAMAPAGPATTTPPPAAAPAAPSPPVIGKGILGCPTVAAPAQGSASSTAALSSTFKTTCATCHGSDGQGSALYPSLPGKLSQAEFMQVVRNGKNVMPPFPAQFVSDTDLAGDYAILSKRNAVTDAKDAAAAEWGWTDAQVQAAYTTGMAAWRKPDVDGAACANCHSPDAIDLAVIGFSDDAILRRAYKHIPPADALAVRDLVHAQRRRFGIRTPCSPDWRPFQPGGEPLPGNTPDEQDAAFAAELQQMGLLIATGHVATLDDAHRVQAELGKINLRTLRIGIPLPRWTEDSFRGDAHRTINDHMAAVPHIPNDPSWYAKMDAYIANPTEAAVFDLIFSLPKATNDGGYLKSTPRVDVCGTTNAGGFIEEVADAKYRGVLLLQHYMRMAVLGKPGWLDLPQAAYAGLAQPYNPWFNIGGRNVERVCPYPQDMTARPIIASTLPGIAKVELSPTDVQSHDFVSLSHDMAHAWMTLGQIFDQTLYMSEGAPNNKLNYWVQDATFLQKEVHLPFMYFHRLIVQQKYRQDAAYASLLPRAGAWYREGKALPLLDGPRLMIHNQGTTGATDLAKPFAPLANRIRGNLYRTILLLQKELLQAGTPATQDGTADAMYRLTFETDRLGDLARKLQEWQKDPKRAGQVTAALGADLDLYTTQTLSLLAEVQSLLAAAPKLKPDN